MGRFFLRAFSNAAKPRSGTLKMSFSLRWVGPRPLRNRRDFSRSAAHRDIASPRYPNRWVGLLNWRRTEGHVVQLEVLTLIRHVVFRPEPAHHLQTFICLSAAMSYVQTRGLELHRVFSAHAYAQSYSTTARDVQRGCHLGEHRRVVERRKDYGRQ